jgi:signal transduction histidine kinase
MKSSYALTVLLLTALSFSVSRVRAVDAVTADAHHPRRIAIGQSIQPEDVGKWIEVEGTVTFAGRVDRDLNLELSSGAGRMTVTVIGGPDTLWHLLLKSRVRIHGICAGIQSIADGTLVASLHSVDPSNLQILQAAEETWQRYGSQSLSTAVGSPEAAKVAPDVVHLRGRLSNASGAMTIADESGKITISTTQDLSEFVGREVEALGVIQSDAPKAVFYGAVLRPILAATGSSTALPTLTTMEQVHWLKTEDAARRYPVKVRGVITWIQPSLRNGSVADGTDGVYVTNLYRHGRTPLDRGTYCEIEGVTIPGRFAPGIECQKLTVLGNGQYPEPLRPSWMELNTGTLDVQWVEIQGVVLAAASQNLTVAMKGGRITCNVPDLDDAKRYLNALVRIRGVVVYHANADREFHQLHIDIPAQDFISIESPAPGPDELPVVRHVGDLLHYSPSAGAFHRVKVLGQIIHVRNGVYYLTEDGTGFEVVPHDVPTNPLPVGAVVEAAGFPDIDAVENPILTIREAVLTQVGQNPLPTPRELTADKLPNPALHSTLVRIAGRLMNLAQYQDEQVLELETGGRIYRARLNIGAAHALPTPVDSRLEVTGVYVVEKSTPIGSGAFELFLNSAADIRIVQRPSWWTRTHTAIVVGSMTLLLLLVTGWVAILRQQVGRRTVQLSTVNESLRREMKERHKVEDALVRVRSQHLVDQERNRIARDLHDDLGSRVTRVVLMLDELALDGREASDNSRDRLRKVSNAAQEIIHSLDENVWAVNSGNDTLPHLIDYIGLFATDFLSTANVRCRMDFPDDPPELPVSAEVRHNVFLAAKEALTNAVRHGHPTEIWISATCDAGKTLTVVINDNGQGFETTPNHPSADGLRNMRQRMEAIGGRFEIESGPNGTKIALRVTLAGEVANSLVETLPPNRTDL